VVWAKLEECLVLKTKACILRQGAKRSLRTQLVKSSASALRPKLQHTKAPSLRRYSLYPSQDLCPSSHALLRSQPASKRGTMPTPNDQHPSTRLLSTLFPQQFRWYLPTFHGDLQLEKTGAMETELRVFELTDTEEKALAILRKRATKVPFSGKPWADDKEFLPASSAQYRTKSGLVIAIRAPIEDVEKVLSKALNVNKRKLLSVVKFSDGSMEKIIRRDEEEKDVDNDDVAAADVIPDYAKDKANKDREAKAAATVKKPAVGCPMPEFPEADIRASRVLEAFLNDAQIADYRKYGAFMTVGRDTGHRYIVANRETPQALKQCQGRQLFDVEENCALCVHDWEVPPPEEMLALHLCLSIPGYEHYVRTLPEAFR
jgi:hypothetical protein